MDDSVHPQQSKVLETDTSFFGTMLRKLMPSFVKRFVVRSLLHDGAYLSDKSKATVAGCVVMWYHENDIRHFIMVKDEEESDKSRFVSFIDLDEPKTAHQMIQQAVSTQLGDVFYKGFDEKLLNASSVLAAPTFYGIDDLTGANVPLQTLVWAVQITPEQVQLINTEASGQELSIISEYGVLGPDIEPSHKVIYQTVLRNIHSRDKQHGDLSNDRLQQLLDAVDTTTRTVH